MRIIREDRWSRARHEASPGPVARGPNSSMPVSITGGTMPSADLPLLESGDSDQYPVFITVKMATFNRPIFRDQKIFLGIDKAIHIVPDVSTESRSGTEQPINYFRSLSSITHADPMIIQRRAPVIWRQAVVSCIRKTL